LVFAFIGLMLFPWLVVWFNVPDLSSVISGVGLKPLLISNLLSMSWGVANILYMVCVIRIGAALTGAVLSALGMLVGIVMPMVLKGSGLFRHAPDLMSKAGIFISVGILIIVAGIILVSLAGFEREKILNAGNNQLRKGQPSGSFLQGLILVVMAGILSSGLSLAFVYSQGPIIDLVKLQGADDMTANITVWALGVLGGALINIFYAVYLMATKGTWKLLFSRKDELLYGSLVGLQFFISIVFMGRGMVFLGALGASVGFGIQQSMQVVGNQLVGFVGGEWKGVNGKPRKMMYLGLVIILIAVIVFSYCNTIG
jgi:L-rhamnose-H+ transport protein